MTSTRGFFTLFFEMKANQLLKTIVERKQIDNPRLSLRWIASRMGIASGRLSELINAKRPLTPYYASKLCKALKLSDDECHQLYGLVHSSDMRANAGQTFEGKTLKETIDWKHFAILTFLQTSTYQKIGAGYQTQSEQAREISNLIEIPESELTSILDSMATANIIDWINDLWIPTQSKSSAYDFTDRILEDGHINNLTLAKEKFKSHSIYERDFSAMTLILNPEDVEKAKKKIRNFKKTFASSMESSEKIGVYQMNIQFFPIIISDSKKD